LDARGNLILDINSNKPRIPASNQKLISTAYALDKLGPNHTLNTSLFNPSIGKYYIIGNGNPDLSIRDIRIISEKIINSLPYNYKDKVSITLFEEEKQSWWPNSWSSYDRSNTYGAPITRIAVNSNSNSFSLTNPILYLKQIIDNDLNYYGLFAKYDVESPINPEKDKIGDSIFTVKSAPIYALLALSNAESHNFTAEVLLRNSFNDWNVKDNSHKVINWLRFKRIPVDGINIIDGSGLSRMNRITSYSLVRLLANMDRNRHSEYYLSSMSLYGIRGTLKNYPYSKTLDSNFYGKTGTLEGVRAISGILKHNNQKLFISVIANDIYNVDSKIYKILETISINNCLFAN
tara:strand:- start:6028 stop:7071 length:1044 start_codon:yes stop_codon:yes gene_type:complete